MRILYFSVHQILEYDEISLFTRLGHEVFTLGSFFGRKAVQDFRPLPAFLPESENYLEVFERLGGRYRYGAPAQELVIPPEFVAMFDVVVVMHDLDLIELHWNALSMRPIVWRSIGVGTQEFEPRVSALRAQGMQIVRYCPTESRADGYAGHDRIIRFGKVDVEESWQRAGNDILTFSHAYRQRFPAEFDFRQQAIAGFSALLGGSGNDDVEGRLNVVDFEEQKRLLSSSAIYFYASGSFIPYTLNFMEAWLSGIPLVAIDCRAIYAEDQRRFAEVPSLVENEVNGFLVRSPAEARDVFCILLDDVDLAQRIGAAGAAKARSLFAEDVVAPEWQSYLQTFN